jgi:hypothetical protein
MEKIEGFDFEVRLLYFGLVDMCQDSHVGHVSINLDVNIII